MKEIKKLDNKYLVIKIEDLEKYFSQYSKGIFTTDEEQKTMDSISFKVVLHETKIQRELEGKKDNKYLVLKLDDKFDFQELINKHKHERFLRVNDIAIDLVNSILKTKEVIQNDKMYIL